MTIVIPGLDQQLQPAIQGFGALAQHFMNPDKQYVDELRKAIQEGRISPQELNNMTPEEISRKFNIKLKNAQFFTTGQPDAATTTNRAVASNIQRIMALPDGTPEKTEFLAGKTGTLTPTQRTKETAGATSAVNAATLSSDQVAQYQKDLQSPDPKVREAAQAALGGRATSTQLGTQENQGKIVQTEAEKATKEEADRLAAKATVGKTLLRIGGSANLYSAYKAGQLSTEEQAALYNDPDTKKVYEMQQNDYWERQRLQQQKDIAEGRINKDKIFEEQDAMLARKYADVANRSNAKDIFTVLRDPILKDRYTAMKDAPADPGERNIWEAAQAIKEAQTREDTDRLATARNQFRLATQVIMQKLNSPIGLAKSGIDEQAAQALVAQYNTAAIQTLGGYLPSDKIPQIAFNRQGPDSKRPAWVPDKSEIYFTQGQDSELANAKMKPPVDPAIEQVAQDIASDKPGITLEGQLLHITDPKEKEALKARVAELKGAKK